MDKAIQSNLKLWNEWTKIHEASNMYDLDGFRKGRNSLHQIELEELGKDVAGKSLLHLQCHFGMDTLSWARMGADVTGVDFSDEAIRLARSLSEELRIPATFIQSEVTALPEHLEGQYDIVYTSYGVLTWLPDLTKWAKTINHFLKTGGIFYIVEFHPFFMILDDADTEQGWKIEYPYFHSAGVVECPVEGSYADRSAYVQQKSSYEWSYSVGEILNSLISEGLEIQYFHEFLYSVHQGLQCMTKGGDGYYRIKGAENSIPLMFSLRAIKR